MKLRNSEEKSDAMKRLHDDLRKDSKKSKKETTEEEWVKSYSYGGSAET